MRAFHLASAAEDPAAQVELLESLSWTYTELGYPQRAIECMMLLCQLHEQRDEAEALVSTLVALSSLHLMVGEADEALACLERALDDAQAKLPANLPLRAKVMSELGNVWVQLGHAERAVELYTSALGAAEEAGDPSRHLHPHPRPHPHQVWRRRRGTARGACVCTATWAWHSRLEWWLRIGLGLGLELRAKG